MCNKLVASPSLIDFHYYYQRDKTAKRERGRVQSKGSSGADLSCQLAWSGYEILRMHLRHFSWTSTPATLLSKYFNAVCLVPPVAVHVFLSLRFGVFGANLLCGLLMRSQYDGWLADCLPVCISSPPLSLSLSLSVSFSVCLCVCVSWLSSLLDKLNLLFSVFQYKRQACYDKNWLLSKWNLFPLLLLLLYLSPPSLLYSAAAVAFPCRAVTTPSWSGDRAHRMIALQCPLLTPHCPTHILVFIRFLSFLLRIELFAWVGLVSAAAQICALGMLSLFLPCRKCGSGWCMCGKAILFAAFWLWEIKRPQGRYAAQHNANICINHSLIF